MPVKAGKEMLTEKKTGIELLAGFGAFLEDNLYSDTNAVLSIFCKNYMELKKNFRSIQAVKERYVNQSVAEHATVIYFRNPLPLFGEEWIRNRAYFGIL